MVAELVASAMRRAAEALRGAGLDPVLVGGLALQLHRRIRQTKDADFLAAVEEPRFEEVFRSAEAAGLRRDPKRPVLRLGEQTILRLVYEDPATGVEIRIDLIRAGNDFLRSAVARAVPVETFGIRQRVATCEDLVLMKLLAGRAIDLADAVELLRENRPQIDRGYLDRWAAALGIRKELADADREAT